MTGGPSLSVAFWIGHNSSCAGSKKTSWRGGSGLKNNKEWPLVKALGDFPAHGSSFHSPSSNCPLFVGEFIGLPQLPARTRADKSTSTALVDKPVALAFSTTSCSSMFRDLRIAFESITRRPSDVLLE